MVSRFCELGNITTDVCELQPAFHPSIMKYNCIWWWEHKPWAAFTPHFNKVNCTECELKLPDPERNPRSHLSLSFETTEPTHWQAFHEPEKAWNRTFLYGETHTIPVTVVSADKFTHKTCEVTMLRDCP